MSAVHSSKAIVQPGEVWEDSGMTLKWMWAVLFSWHTTLCIVGTWNSEIFGHGTVPYGCTFFMSCWVGVAMLELVTPKAPVPVLGDVKWIFSKTHAGSTDDAGIVHGMQKLPRSHRVNSDDLMERSSNRPCRKFQNTDGNSPTSHRFTKMITGSRSSWFLPWLWGGKEDFWWWQAFLNSDKTEWS